MPRSVKAWLSHHLYVFFSSLGQLNRTLLPSLMTAAVIGIALALPAGLYLLLENALQVSRAWDSSVQISLFLKHEVADSRAYELKRLLEQRKDIVGIQVITREQALEEYRKLSGFGDALDALDENPLPMVLTIQPILNHPHSSQELLEDLNELPEVDIAQFDVYWLKRLFAIMEIVRRGVLVLAALLALAVLLIVGNTIRLAIENRRTEIEVNKLFGATDAFIRRPFLYSGLWYGFFGGLIAWMLVKLAFWSLQEPAKRLIALYHSHYELVTLGWNSSLVLLLLGIFLGLGGAWLAVGRHLQDIQPR
ncbi:MAG: cell division protein FtsX [Gammaproteobacteria bacterium]|nr:cell division protein FtsX [Gammaproteobacteria bacterium]